MRLNLVVIGPGLVGAEFLKQIAAFQTNPKLNTALLLSVVAITNSRKYLFDRNGIELANWKSLLEGSPNPGASVQELTSLVKQSSSEPCIMVDCTSNENIAQQYPFVLRQGIHIVTPNKKGFSGSLKLYEEIKRLAISGNVQGLGSKGPLLFHESTVGAGLPILSTLTDIVETGDTIVKIEGIFSGTLSYIFNNFSQLSGTAANSSFSEIVKVAQEKGYTEPDPRDDLNGVDVARKVVILGRLIGLPLSLETINVENIVPAELREVATSSEFLQKLPEFDGVFAQSNRDAKANGQVLRYIGTINPSKPEETGVRLLKVSSSHPFASLSGSDNIIAITTKRFTNPLVIQGAGAGASVTAFGMFGDVLKIARCL